MFDFKNLLRLFKRGDRGFHLPKSTSEIGDYCENFSRAVAFTRLRGFRLEHTEWLATDVIGADGTRVERAMLAAGVQDAGRSANQCLKWSHYLSPYFELEFGCRVWPTLGQIWEHEHAVYHPSWADLKRWAKSGVQVNDLTGKVGINFHAWLTLESGEIIEPTMLSSLAIVRQGQFSKNLGYVAWGRDPSVLNGFRYFPMAVGREFVESVSRKSIVPLLASNSDELHQITTIMVPA